jgi:hypothetical protein
VSLICSITVPYLFQSYYRPTNKKELFNLCHLLACNVIERTFGVLKKHFKILLLPAAYSMDIQAQILAALCALHVL